MSESYSRITEGGRCWTGGAAGRRSITPSRSRRGTPAPDSTPGLFRLPETHKIKHYHDGYTIRGVGCWSISDSAEPMPRRKNRSIAGRSFFGPSFLTHNSPKYLE